MAETAGTGGNLERVIGDLKALSTDMNACAVLSKDGRLLYSSHAPGVERERASAMLTALRNLADHNAHQNGQEHATQLRVDTPEGHLLLVRLEDGGVLAATAEPEARVGLVLYDMRNARSEVEKAAGGAEGGSQ
jgi:predicted regulator of Ras-like GTPase activity (Roadblock/LC7/MglB family)